METASYALVSRSPAGRPAEAAFACAMVEHAATAFQDGLHPDGFYLTGLLRRGRGALRAELGIEAGALSQAALDALLAAAAAFRRDDPAGAAAALAPLAGPGHDPARRLLTLVTPAPLRQALVEARRMLAPGASP